MHSIQNLSPFGSGFRGLIPQSREHSGQVNEEFALAEEFREEAEHDVDMQAGSRLLGPRQRPTVENQNEKRKKEL